MIEDIKKNIDSEIRMLREISVYMDRITFARPAEKNLLATAIDSLKNSMKIVNDSIPGLVAEVGIGRKELKLGPQKKVDMAIVSFHDKNEKLNLTIPKKDRETFMKELNISRDSIKRLKRGKLEEKEEYSEFKAARGYLKLANKLFLDRSIEAIKKGKYKKLSRELQKANIDILFQSYVALIYTTVFFSTIVSLMITTVLFFFELNLGWPIFSLYGGSYLFRLMQIFWIPIVVPLIIFAVMYLYPMSERSSLAKRVNQELAFAVIHMSAISGSGIQPSEIFRIIALNKEYPYLRKEIRKVLNQINLYGYDLVTALNNAATTTSSNKLSELFSGLATTITSGGDLREFFNKRAETLLNDYRLERQKYAKTAETFMDIYISVVIAAPMILMLLLIMLTLGNFDLGFSTGQLTFLIISIISLINVVFLIFVHLNQPSY